MSSNEKSIQELTSLSSIHWSLKTMVLIMVYMINFSTLYLFIQFFVVSDQWNRYVLFFITSFILAVPSFALMQKIEETAKIGLRAVKKDE